MCSILCTINALSWKQACFCNIFQGYSLPHHKNIYNDKGNTLDIRVKITCSSSIIRILSRISSAFSSVVSSSSLDLSTSTPSRRRNSSSASSLEMDINITRKTGNVKELIHLKLLVKVSTNCQWINAYGRFVLFESWRKNRLLAKIPLNFWHNNLDYKL